MFDLRLIRADALKLRRRRGMLALSIAMTFGILALVYTVTGIQHATNASHYGPAGGLKNYKDSMYLMTLLMLVVGAVIGATAGAQDLESGVFRDLAATGRSRLALFGARVPGSWTIVGPIALLVSTAAAIASFAFAGGLATPGTAAIFAATVGVLAAGMLSAAVSVGLAALTGSKAAVIATVLAFVLAIAPLLDGLGFLGSARNIIPTDALARIGHAPHQTLHIALFTAIASVICWAAVACAGGARRTQTREI